jgi:hypothetical protein
LVIDYLPGMSMNQGGRLEGALGIAIWELRRLPAGATILQYNQACMAERIQCDACGVIIPAHAHYVVRIDVYADPSLPDLSMEELEEMDTGKTLDALMKQMKHMSAEELQDQVHRRFEYRLCPLCQKEFLSNPLGLPRKRPMSSN